MVWSLHQRSPAQSCSARRRTGGGESIDRYQLNIEGELTNGSAWTFWDVPERQLRWDPNAREVASDHLTHGVAPPWDDAGDLEGGRAVALDGGIEELPITHPAGVVNPYHAFGGWVYGARPLAQDLDAHA